jgi:hypothetical protein
VRVGFLQFGYVRSRIGFGRAFATVVVISAGLVLAGLSTTSVGAQEKTDNKTIRIQEYPGSIVSLHNWVLLGVNR